MGITKNAFTDWKSGKIKSYQKHLPKIAEFFGVSADYLLGLPQTDYSINAKEEKTDMVDELKIGMRIKQRRQELQMTQE